MTGLSLDTLRCTVTLDPKSAQVFVTQRWLYMWTVRAPLPRWTTAEQRRFQVSAESGIRQSWDNRAYIRASGTSDLARQLAGKKLKVRIDIQSVHRNPHWTVTVQKVPPDLFVQSLVHWEIGR